MRKKVAASLVLIVSVLIVGGCQKPVTREAEPTKTKTETEKEPGTITETDLKDTVTGIEDHYIVQGAKDIDYLKEVEYDKKIVSDVKADTSKVNLKKAGTYPVAYTVTVDTAAFEQKDAAAKTSKTTGQTTETVKADTTKTDTTEKTKSDAQEATSDPKDKSADEQTKVEIGTEVKVVTEDEAQKLADKGESVWTDANKVLAKSDAAKDDKKQASDQKTSDDKKIASAKKDKDTNQGTSAKQEARKESPGSSSNRGSSNTDNASTGNNNAGGSTPTKTTQTQSTPQHTHQFVAQTHVVHHEATGHNEQYVTVGAWDEIVTEEVYDPWECCNVCGADCTADPSGHMEAHALAYEGGGRHTEYYKTVTHTVHHDAEYGTRWVQDSAAWDETVSDGAVCSCGATQ